MPHYTQLFVRIEEAWADLDDKSILNELRMFGPLIDIRRPNPYIAFVTMTEENKNSALQREARADLPSWMTVARAHNPRPTNPSVYIDRNENNVCRAHLLGHCGDGENCILGLQHPWYRFDVDYDEILHGKKTKKINFDEQEQSREATSSTVINHDLVRPKSTVIITPNASSEQEQEQEQSREATSSTVINHDLVRPKSTVIITPNASSEQEQEQEQSREATSSTVINHDLVGPKSTDNDSIDSTGSSVDITDESVEDAIADEEILEIGTGTLSSSTQALVIESFTDGKHDVIPLFENGSGGECFQHEGLQFRADDVYRLPIECLRFGRDANERTCELSYVGYVATLPKELLKRQKLTLDACSTAASPSVAATITPHPSYEGDESIEEVVSSSSSSQCQDNPAETLFGGVNFTNMMCSDQDCRDNCTGHASDELDPSERACYEDNWEKRSKFIPSRSCDPEDDWEYLYGMTNEELDRRRVITLEMLQPFRTQCPDLVDYFSELIKIVMPGDRLFFILLHCALQMSRKHVSLNCGGGHAYGEDFDLASLDVCSIKALEALSGYFEKFSTINMGFTAKAIGAINGRQGLCPTQKKDFAPCPPLDDNDTTPEVVVAVLRISFRHFEDVKASSHIFSAAGTTTMVNERILDKLLSSFGDSDYTTISKIKMNHIQFFRREFPHDTHMHTYEKMSALFLRLSECIGLHLERKCRVSPGTGISLFDFGCDCVNLPMIGNESNVTNATLEKLVRSAKQPRQKAILEYCSRYPDSRVSEAPPYVRGYVATNLPHILRRMSEYLNEGRVDEEQVPESFDDVFCWHVLSNMGINSWEKLSPQEQKEQLNIMNLSRKRVRDESDDTSGDVREGRTRRVKAKRCSDPSCDNQVVKGGLCIRHGEKKPICSMEDCDNQVVKGGLCIRHGEKKPICSMEDCDNQVVKGGLCIRHGAKVARCSMEDCDKKVWKGGLCYRNVGVSMDSEMSNSSFIFFSSILAFCHMIIQ